jgi:glutamine synthetase
MKGKLDLQQLEDLVSTSAIDTVLVCMIDMQGRLIGKRVTGHFFLEHAHKEMHVCDYLLTVDMDMEPVPGFEAASWDLGYGDLSIRPDLATLRLIPWLPATALVLADCHAPDGSELEHAPRTMLRRQIERLEAFGLEARMGSELELYVFDDSYTDARSRQYTDLNTSSWYSEDYHIFQTTKEESLIRAIRNGMDGAAVPVEFSKGEWGPGQQEINLRYAGAMEMADRHVIYKNGAKEIAFLQDKAISFMAKWRGDLAGNSCHIHSSLWHRTTGESAFHDPDQPHGMSNLFRHFLAGQLLLASEYTLLLAPYVNSYKRFQEGSFAPTRIVWSVDNRTAGYRLVGEGPSLRSECRIPGADCNPYVAFAALIAAGIYGMDQGLELEPAFVGNAYEDPDVTEVPSTLGAAIEALDRSDIMRDLLGDDVISHYVHAARGEMSDHDRYVNDWELRRYFERA